MANLYLNIKVQALLDGAISVDSSWTRDDFAALSVAAADQAGCSIREQMRIAAIVATMDGEVDAATNTNATTNAGAR